MKANRKIPAAKTNPVKVKKDALWKPLLRRFRKFIQDAVGSQMMQGKMFDHSIEQRSQAYCRALQVPDQFKTSQKSQLAIFSLVESSTVISKRQIKPEFKARFAAHLEYIERNFVRIFVENSVMMRLRFFSDPLVQFLWTKFRTSGGRIFEQIMNQL